MRKADEEPGTVTTAAPFEPCKKNWVSLWGENVEDQKPFKDVPETRNDVTSC